METVIQNFIYIILVDLPSFNVKAGDKVLVKEVNNIAKTCLVKVENDKTVQVNFSEIRARTQLEIHEEFKREIYGHCAITNKQFNFDDKVIEITVLTCGTSQGYPEAWDLISFKIDPALLPENVKQEINKKWSERVKKQENLINI